MDPAKRIALHQRLAGLLPSQLDELALSLGMPAGHQPARELNKADRANLFLQWAEQNPERLARVQERVDAQAGARPRSMDVGLLALNQKRADHTSIPRSKENEDMAHSSKPQHAPAPPTLTFPLVKAQAMVQERIDEGQKLLAIQPRPGDEFKELKKRAWSWFNYNVALLARIVDSQELKDEFDNAGLVYALSADYQPLANHHEHLERCVAKLESILERLPLYERSAPAESTVARPIQGNSVFLVHGHITAIKAEVARAIERLRLPLTILHEQPDKGRTIIEKFEEHAAAVDFAVVLLTGDDRGAGPDSPDSLSPRARQNVIFELGFFYGKLGRKRVCALYEVGVEIPSELSGILFIPLDVGGAWRVSLAREMKSAGLDIDMNLAM